MVAETVFPIDLKVLMIADVQYENPCSGSEQVLFHQSQGLTENGAQVFAITRQTNASVPQTVKNINGVKVASYYAPLNSICCFIFSVLKKPRRLYDILFAHNAVNIVVAHQPTTVMALWLKGEIRNIPWIYVFHSPWHKEYLIKNQGKQKFIISLLAAIRRYVEMVCVRRSKKVIVLSEYMRGEIQRAHRIPAERLSVIPGGVDLQFFTPLPDRAGLKKELNLPKQKIHLLTVRNLEPRMGLDRLLDCMGKLKESKLNVHLTIGGEGQERQKLTALIRNYGLLDTVRMDGFIPPHRLPHYYGAADFFVIPTRKLEGFGLVTPESMACGTPVLGTPVGGTQEILTNFNPDFLFQNSSSDAMAEGIQRVVKMYFSDCDQYNKLRLRCREYAEKNYSWQRHIDQFVSILQKYRIRDVRG